VNELPIFFGYLEKPTNISTQYYSKESRKSTWKFCFGVVGFDSDL